MSQIEQFIETLFPSQDVKNIKALHSEKAESNKSENDLWDSLLLVLAVVMFMLVVSGIMVRIRTVSFPHRPCLPAFSLSLSGSILTFAIAWCRMGNGCPMGQVFEQHCIFRCRGSSKDNSFHNAWGAMMTLFFVLISGKGLIGFTLFDDDEPPILCRIHARGNDALPCTQNLMKSVFHQGTSSPTQGENELIKFSRATYCLALH
jgi:hypothetical protein